VAMDSPGAQSQLFKWIACEYGGLTTEFAIEPMNDETISAVASLASGGLV